MTHAPTIIPHRTMIRPATIHDIPRIQEIISSHAELGKMLFKSLAQLYESLRDFAVYELDAEANDFRVAPGLVVGCTALSVLWADLAEVRSLAVDEDYRGRGIGRRLVEWAADEARRLQIRRIMALTYEQAFFEKLGFEVVQKESLPLKVWSDCVRCPKKDNCDEIAMVRNLRDVPMIVMHQAPPTPRGISIPVLQDAFED
jgi:amino-acid N-acetyltransferase